MSKIICHLMRNKISSLGHSSEVNNVPWQAHRVVYTSFKLVLYVKNKYVWREFILSNSIQSWNLWWKQYKEENKNRKKSEKTISFFQIAQMSILSISERLIIIRLVQPIIESWIPNFVSWHARVILVQ